MSDTGSTPQGTGDIIGADIAAAEKIITPILTDLDPVIGKGVGLALRIVAKVEPAAYKAIAAIFSGQPLTPEQEAAITTIEGKLNNPEGFFA